MTTKYSKSAKSAAAAVTDIAPSNTNLWRQDEDRVIEAVKALGPRDRAAFLKVWDSLVKVTMSEDSYSRGNANPKLVGTALKRLYAQMHPESVTPRNVKRAARTEQIVKDALEAQAAQFNSMLAAYVGGKARKARK